MFWVDFTRAEATRCFHLSQSIVRERDLYFREPLICDTSCLPDILADQCFIFNVLPANYNELTSIKINLPTS